MTTPPRPAGLLRRLLAFFYDSLLLFAILMGTTALAMALRGGDLNPQALPFQTLLLAVVGLFYVGFWTHGGQTLGMKAWRLRVETRDGRPLGRRQALLRFLAAVVSTAFLGLGFAWALVDRRRRTWHDIWSRSRMIDLR